MEEVSNSNSSSSSPTPPSSNPDIVEDEINVADSDLEHSNS